MGAIIVLGRKVSLFADLAVGDGCYSEEKQDC